MKLRLGFTLLELAIIIIIISIIAVAATSKILQTRTTLASALLKIRGDILFTQNLALSHGAKSFIDIKAKNYDIGLNIGTQINIVKTVDLAKSLTADESLIEFDNLYGLPVEDMYTVTISNTHHSKSLIIDSKGSVLINDE